MSGATNTVSVIHVTEQDGSSFQVHVYVVPDSRMTSSQRRELDSFTRDDADLFEVNRHFEAHKIEASTPIVGNISHVYFFHVSRAPDSIPDSYSYREGEYVA